MNATTRYGALQTIAGMFIEIPSAKLDIPHFVHEPTRAIQDLKEGATTTNRIYFETLPEITENKSATYNDEIVLGRSSPVKTFAHGDNRVITLTMNFIATHESDFIRYRQYMFAIASAAHPRYEQGYAPPDICKIQIGGILGNDPVSCVLRNYDFNTENTTFWYDRDAQDEAERNAMYMSMRFSINTNWDVVYSYESLPSNTDVHRGRF